ncbi:unnamed protein product [Orchesella dallaii]|uniref:DUF3719 domain-containing protein n=1 Tax=Orchesella dallaii TaxID=48710 RepID=A0ABP1RE28_9HEXA
MGGKRTSDRSNSGKDMHSRISSADSTKSFVIESPPIHSKNNLSTEELPEFLPRKSSFDIISLLVSHEDSPSSPKAPRNGERDHFIYDQSENSSGIPSFWHLVQPETASHEIFQQHPQRKEVKGHHQHQSVTNKRNTSASPMAYAPGGRKLGDFNRRLKRRKMKKVQSAKVGGFKVLESSPERLQGHGVEWLRVLTPPETDSVSLSDADDNEGDHEDEDDDDELIKRYFSGLSSAGSSISWAEDAMESEFTSQLRKLWDDIEMVCRGGSRPKEMSDAVHDECLQWRRAFPNLDLHRLCSPKNEEPDVSPVDSPTLDEERGEGDAQFSSLVHTSRFERGRKDFDDKVDLLQASFRSLNCATPRPNIEKSTEYVSAWLSECQNSYVPDGDRTLSDYNHSRPSTPSTSLRNSSMQLTNEKEKSRQSLQAVPDLSRSPCTHYSKSHAKFVAEPDPQNFFTSLAITSNENGYGAYPTKNDGISNSTEDTQPSAPFLFNYQSRIKESDEEEDDGRTSPSSPTDIISFRPNVRVQRPISSRIRDHAITPIATGSYAHSSAFHGRHHHGVNLNRQQTATTNSRSHSLPQPQGTGLGGRIGIFDNSYVSIPTSATNEARTRRIHSGLTKPAHSIQQYGRSRQSLISSIGQQQQQQQAPWSRHTGDDLVMESNYVTSLYENYQTGGGSSETINVGGRTNLLSMRSNELVTSPTSPKESLSKFQRSPNDEGSISIPECEDRSFKPAVSWLMNRVSPH